MFLAAGRSVNAVRNLTGIEKSVVALQACHNMNLQELAFQDAPHLLQLQRDLWQWPKGRAALMVGAGFSRNARALPGIRSRFPTWRELVRVMYDALNPELPNESIKNKEDREKHFNGTSALRIASEYEAAFGREKLERLIREQNPDLDFLPSDLHRTLLELPWSDVFTTNYDTLLERSEILSRNYQTVTKSEELPSSFPPRIVKLHGSFPSQTPFTITEEDYRTYPRKAAPFVNTVRQALLENAFVLVGFSGDDPNFLEWTGWIRDELGENHAPIYLVGPLFLGNAQRLLLGRRGVTPIDLGPLFKTTPSETIHRDSIEWLVGCLQSAKPDRADHWPDFSRRNLQLKKGLPPLIGRIEDAPTEVAHFPKPGQPLTDADVKHVLSRWQFERTHYPGWLVLPHVKRSTLWARTKFWLHPLFKFSEHWPAFERLILFREINWRLETAMVPLFPQMIEPFEKVVNEAAPAFLSGVIGAQLTHEQHARARVAWAELAFGLLREARESFNETRWTQLEAQISSMVEGSTEFEDRRQYEQILWDVWNLRRNLAKANVSKWQPPQKSPLWNMRRAGLLAELDELAEARMLVRSALLDLRRVLKSHNQNIELLSMEGWITYLTFAVETAENFATRQDTRQEFAERWQELKQWDCSPWEEKDFFDQELSKVPPELEQQIERDEWGFDPGYVTHSMSYKNCFDAFLPAFACVRLCEQVGVPLRLPGLNIMGDALGRACDWIAPFIGFWSPAILIRAGAVEQLTKNKGLTRSAVAAMNTDVARRLYDWCVSCLETELKSISSSINARTGQGSSLRAIPEIVSRFLLKLPNSELQKSFSLALRLHTASGIRTHFEFHKICVPWFKRLFEAAPNSLLVQWLPDLLRLPLWDGMEELQDPLDSNRWPDPMEFFPAQRVRRESAAIPTDSERVRGAIDWLLNQVASEAGVARQRALTRLIAARQAGFFADAHDCRFGSLLWADTGDSGLPNLPNLLSSAVLDLPIPPSIPAQDRVKRYILSCPVSLATKPGPQGMISIASPFGWSQRFLREAIMASKPIISFRGEPLVGVEWTAEEVEQLYRQAKGWWEHDKRAVKTPERRKGSGFPGGNAVLNEGRELPQFLGRVVIPYVAWSDEKWQDLQLWLRDLREKDIFPTSISPLILLHVPGMASNFESLVLGDLEFGEPEAVARAADAVRLWTHLAAAERIPLFTRKVLRQLVCNVVFRRKIRPSYSVETVAHLLVEQPACFTEEDTELLIASLGPWNDALTIPVAEGSLGEFVEGSRPHLRRAVAGLAGALRKWRELKNFSDSEPAGIALWHTICSNDPLPEVRRAFLAWDDYDID